MGPTLLLLLSGPGGETIACVDHRRVNAVLGFNDPSSRRYDVELERPHGRIRPPSGAMGFTFET